MAADISQTLEIPTIGIGAGPGCDGQVIVTPDMLGLNVDFHPKFVRLYAEGAKLYLDAFARYINDVKSGKFPDDKESY